jgi:hypothetical protein
VDAISVRRENIAGMLGLYRRHYPKMSGTEKEETWFVFSFFV